MSKYTIKLMTINDVKEFVTAANYCKFDIDLTSGRYIVDGKSLMGIFSIVPSEKLEMTIYSENVRDFSDFLDRIEKFIIE